MQDDIRPPKNTNRRLMPGRRPRGINSDGVRERLPGGSGTSRKPAQAVNELSPLEKLNSPLSLHKGDSVIKKPRRFMWWRRLSKNKRFAVISAVLLVFGIFALGVYYIGQPSSNPSIEITKSKKKKVVVPATVPSPLTGLQVTPELAARPVTGIMIENSRDARPQSGLSDAGVVYEAIAEGGITRFLALFEEAQPQYVGPVRSLRPYYIDWLAPYDASIAHVGGSPAALAQIRAGMKDLDQFFNAGSYWRVSSRPAPHNVYTSFAKLDALNSAKGYKTSKFTGPTRKSDAKLAVPTAKTIDLAVSSALYNVHYDYDAASNTYLRSEGGAPHKTTASEADRVGQQLHPNVVVALIMAYSLVDSAGHSGYATTGSGQLYIFQDGGVTQGTWSKANRTSQFLFADNSGAPIAINAGQTWYTMLGAANKVTYLP